MSQGKIKLLYIPLAGADPDKEGLYQALSSKTTAMFYQGVDKAIEFQPDVVYMHSGALPNEVATEIKSATKALWTQWTGDCRPEPIDCVVTCSEVCDITLLACGLGQHKMYKKATRKPVYWLQHGVEPHHFKPVREFTNDIVFIANNYTHFPGGLERYQLAIALAEKYPDFKVYGSGWGDLGAHDNGPVPYENTPAIYNKAYIGVSGNIYNDVEGYYSNRPLMILAAGSLLLERWRPGIEQEFTHKQDCLIYHSIEEAITLIDDIKKNPLERQYLANKGRQLAMNHHTTDKRAEQYLDIVKKHLK